MGSTIPRFTPPSCRHLRSTKVTLDHGSCPLKHFVSVSFDEVVTGLVCRPRRKRSKFYSLAWERKQF